MNFLDQNKLWQNFCNLLTVVLLALVLTCGQSNSALADEANLWHQIDLPTDSTLLDMDFADDAMHGWVVGTNRTLLETTDGGNTWRNKKLELGKINYRYVSISFFGNEGWLVGKPALLLHTDDGGQSWQRVGLSAKLPGDPASIVALGPQTAEMATDIGAIYRTEDGARTWQALVTQAVGTTRNLYRSEDGRYIAVSAKGNFYSTWNPGDAAWTQHNRNSSRRVQNMGYAPDGRTWMLNRGGLIQFSQPNDLESWEEAQYPKATDGYGMLDMNFQDDQNVWLAGGGSRLLHSEDGGQTWHREEYLRSVGSNFYRIFFFGHDQGFVLGQSGTLIAYDPPNRS